jgi:hypothetical protein
LWNYKKYNKTQNNTISMSEYPDGACFACVVCGKMHSTLRNRRHCCGRTTPTPTLTVPRSDVSGTATAGGLATTRTGAGHPTRDDGSGGLFAGGDGVTPYGVGRSNNARVANSEPLASATGGSNVPTTTDSGVRRRSRLRRLRRVLQVSAPIVPPVVDTVLSLDGVVSKSSKNQLEKIKKYLKGDTFPCGCGRLYPTVRQLNKCNCDHPRPSLTTPTATTMNKRNLKKAKDFIDTSFTGTNEAKWIYQKFMDKEFQTWNIKTTDLRWFAYFASMVLFDIINHPEWGTRKIRSSRMNLLKSQDKYWKGAEEYLQKHKFIERYRSKDKYFHSKISASFAKERKEWMLNGSIAPVTQTNISVDNDEPISPDYTSPHPLSSVARRLSTPTNILPPDDASIDASTTSPGAYSVHGNSDDASDAVMEDANEDVGLSTQSTEANASVPALEATMADSTIASTNPPFTSPGAYSVHGNSDDASDAVMVDANEDVGLSTQSTEANASVPALEATMADSTIASTNPALITGDSIKPVKKRKPEESVENNNCTWVECERCHLRILENDYNNDFRTHRNGSACHSVINWKSKLLDNKVADESNLRRGIPVLVPRIVYAPYFRICKCYSCSTYWENRRLKYDSSSSDKDGGGNTSPNKADSSSSNAANPASAADEAGGTGAVDNAADDEIQNMTLNEIQTKMAVLALGRVTDVGVAAVDGVIPNMTLNEVIKKMEELAQTKMDELNAAANVAASALRKLIFNGPLNWFTLPNDISTVATNELDAIDNKLKHGCFKCFRDGASYEPLTGVIIVTKTSTGILGGSVEDKSDVALWWRYAEMDLATYWTLRGQPGQRVRLTLPAQCFQFVNMDLRLEFLKRFKNITNYKDVFTYKFIDITVWQGIHFSRAFVVNPWLALFPDINQKDIFSGILYCNSSNAVLSGHNIEDVAETTIKMLNWVREDLNVGGALFNEVNLPAYKLEVPIQDDSWTCGPRSLLASDRLTLAFQECSNIYEDSANDKFQQFSEKYMKYDDNEIYEIRNDLCAIVEGISCIGKKTSYEEKPVPTESNTVFIE